MSTQTQYYDSEFDSEFDSESDLDLDPESERYSDESESEPEFESEPDLEELSPEEALAKQMAETQALIDMLLGNLAAPKPQPHIPTWQPQANIGLWIREACSCGRHSDRFVGWFIKQQHTRLRAFECVRAPLGHPDPELPISHQFMAADTTICPACHVGPELQPFEDLAFDKRSGG